MVDIIELDTEDDVPSDEDHVRVVKRRTTKPPVQIVGDVYSEVQTSEKSAAFGSTPYSARLAPDEAIEEARRVAEGYGLDRIYVIDRT